MIIDAHVHVFPPEAAADRAAFAAGEPAFGWLYEDPQAALASAEDLIAAMDEDGLEKAVVCGFPWRDTKKARRHNDYILEAAAAWPRRIIPLAAVDPRTPEAVREAERALGRGAAGLGEIGVYDADLAAPEVRPGLIALARLCAEADKPLLLHANEPVGQAYPGKSPMTLKGLYDLLKDCPSTRFQLAHLGGGVFFFELLKKEVKEVLANCVFDTAAAPFLYRPRLYPLFVSVAGEDRLLFGSDFPLLGFRRCFEEMESVGLAAALKRKILGLNAKSFWRCD